MTNSDKLMLFLFVAFVLYVFADLVRKFFEHKLNSAYIANTFKLLQGNRVFTDPVERVLTTEVDPELLHDAFEALERLKDYVPDDVDRVIDAFVALGYTVTDGLPNTSYEDDDVDEDEEGEIDERG